MRTVPFMLVSLTIIGCGGPNLSGTWVGDFDCGSEGTYDLEITLEKDDKDNTFVGDGEITADDGEVTFEVEVETVEQAGEALSGGADIILLDNMSPDQMSRAVKLVDGRALTEASGDISMATVRAAAESGVDLISVGALTHSVKALNIALDYESR